MMQILKPLNTIAKEKPRCGAVSRGCGGEGGMELEGGIVRGRADDDFTSTADLVCFLASWDMLVRCRSEFERAWRP